LTQEIGIALASLGMFKLSEPFSSGDELSPSARQGEQATGRQDQAGKASTDDGARDCRVVVKRGVDFPAGPPILRVGRGVENRRWVKSGSRGLRNRARSVNAE